MIRRWAICLAFCFMAGAGFAETRTGPSREYDLKAAFLFNFTQFVDWPPQCFTNASQPYVIGVIGEDPFGKSLDEAVADELVNGRKIEVRRFHNPEDIRECHILFISHSEQTRLDRIFKAIEGQSILTVGETDAFLTRGGIIRFEIVQNRVRFRINLESAKASNLVISSTLLRQAAIVEAKKE